MLSSDVVLEVERVSRLEGQVEVIEEVIGKKPHLECIV